MSGSRPVSQDILCLEYNVYVQGEPKMNGGRAGVGVSVAHATSMVNPDYLLLAAAGYSLYPMHDNLRLLDAHLIFEPLLSSLGVMPQQMLSSAGMCW